MAHGEHTLDPFGRDPFGRSDTGRGTDRRTARPTGDTASTPRAQGTDSGRAALAAGPTPRSALLVEREAECAVLATMLAELGEGLAGRIRITGHPGAGCSALLRHAGQLAEQAGFPVLRAYAAPAETNLPYGVLRQWFPPVEPIGARLWSGVEAGGNGGLLARLRQELRAATRRAPLVLLLDDAQWCDPAGRRLLTALTRLPLPGRLLVVAADNGLPAELPVWENAAAWPAAQGAVAHAHVLPLRPLSTDGVAAMVAEHCGEPAAATVVAALVSATAGSPALLAEALRRATALGMRPTADQASRFAALAADALGDRTARLLDTVPPELAALLQAVAVCDGQLEFDLVCRLAGPLPMAAAQARELLAATGLTTRREPPRPIGAAAGHLLAALPAAARSDLHARAAELGHRVAAPPDAVARLLLGAPPVGAPWAVTALTDRAAHSRAVDRSEEAVRLLSRALREPMGRRRRAELLVELGLTEARTTPGAGDRRLGQVLHTGGADLAPLRLVAADLLVVRGAAELGGAAVLAAANPTTATERAGFDALRQLAAGLPGDAGGRHWDPTGQGCPGDPARSGAAAWLTALDGRDLTRARSLAHAALAEPAGGTTLLAPRIAACQALLLTGDPAAARDGLDAVLLDARRREAAAGVGRALLTRAELELRLGRLDEAARWLGQALREVPLEHWHPALAPAPLALDILLNHWRGQHARAERAAAVRLPAGAEQGVSWAFLLFARGVLCAARDAPAESIECFRECGRRLLARRWTNPALLPWRSLAADALGRLGRRAAAARLALEEQELAERWGVWPARCWSVRQSGSRTIGEEN
ncbi:tetratricopeptide (TPR) repeat protein [Kitasatospora sp. GP30]|uniref:AAA family ATPase n=1 Tax=Kitasatospora sp. GP30 TaxID=3035084 RepID=UPI000CC3E89A|nr:AAA family ATPase [Kitasatospora sp. GP30]MDH6142638.1 tetratricopeptide (TPR) repeat protein [Kitasatospora sp. GP30]